MPQHGRDDTLQLLNFAEFFFCQVRCNARCDRPHKYPLVVNIWSRSWTLRRAFRHLALGYPQVGCLCRLLNCCGAYLIISGVMSKRTDAPTSEGVALTWPLAHAGKCE
jgi:hypothetical protein